MDLVTFAFITMLLGPEILGVVVFIIATIYEKFFPKEEVDAGIFYDKNY